MKKSQNFSHLLLNKIAIISILFKSIFSRS